MNKKTIAIIIEAIPVAAAVLSVVLLYAPFDTSAVKQLTSVTFGLAFLGFVVFFIGRKLAKGDKTVKILGILDLLSTLTIIGIYVLAFVAIAL